MDEYKRVKYIDFLKSTSDEHKNNLSIGKKDIESLYNDLFELHEIPFPPSEFKKYFLHPNIIETLLIQVINSKYLTRDDKFSLQEAFSAILKTLKKRKSTFSVTYR